MKIGVGFTRDIVFATEIEFIGDFATLDDMGLVSFPQETSSYSLYDRPRVVAFGSAELRAIFLRWWEKYLNVFHSGYGGKLSTMMIPSYRGDPATVTMIASDMKDVVARWAWITRNCSQAVFRLQDFFAFSSEKDAVAFKMHFC